MQFQRAIAVSAIGLAVTATTQAQNITFPHDGLDRQYRIHVPDQLPDSPALVLAMHGYGGNNNDMMNNYGWTQLADERGFVVAFPNGTRDSWNNRFWDVDYSFHDGLDIDDDGFLRELALHLQELHATDSNKTYATGFSNGAEMSFQLACRESETFEALAPIVGMMMDTLFTDCNPAVARPILALNGTADDTTWWDGDMDDAAGWGPYRPIPEMIAFWADILGTPNMTSTDLPDTHPNDGSTVTLDVYNSPDHDLELWFYTVIGGGHDYPGVWGNMDIHATIEAWNFFAGCSAFSCIGDIDGDGEVGVNDLLELLGEFSVCTGDCQGDLDGDGDVDVEDVLAMIQYWGATCDIYGACCLTDGTCEYIKSAECAAAEGIWNGEGSSCVTASCSTTAHDECVDAAVVGNGATPFSTVDGSTSIDAYDDAQCAGSYLGALFADIWFAYEASCTGTLTVSTCDAATFDTDLVVYQGACEDKVQIGCSGDDGNCSGYTSTVTVPVTEGEQYLIRLGGWDTSCSGTGSLTIDCQ